MTIKYAGKSIHNITSQPIELSELKNLYGYTENKTIKLDNMYSVDTDTWGEIVSLSDLYLYDPETDKFFIRGQYVDSNNDNSWFTLEELSNVLHVSPTNEVPDCYNNGIKVTDIFCFNKKNSGIKYYKKDSLYHWVDDDEILDGTFFEEAAKPLCFTNVNDGESTIQLTVNGNLNTSYQYSTDGINYSTYTIGDTITLSNIGDKVYFKGTHSTQNSSNYIQFVMTGKIAASGNVFSLTHDTNYYTQNTSVLIYNNYDFFKLFYNCSSLISAPVLPADSLTVGCYYYMFGNCTSLVKAPDINATSLANSCCAYMFQGCTSLTTAPKLPTAAYAYNRCYNNMFYGCTSLVKAPKLPATNLGIYCYQQMFRDCTSLKVPPELSATNLADHCYYYMFQNCTSLETMPELPATTLTTYCYSNMFYGCTSLIKTTELSATILTDYCYNSMFFNCSSLNNVKCNATNISATNCLNNWLYGVSSSGVIYTADDVAYEIRSTSGIPTNWMHREQNADHTWKYYVGYFGDTDTDLNVQTINPIYIYSSNTLINLVLGSKYQSFFSDSHSDRFIIQEVTDTNDTVIPHDGVLYVGVLSNNAVAVSSGSVSASAYKIKFKIDIRDLMFY